MLKRPRGQAEPAAQRPASLMPPSGSAYATPAAPYASTAPPASAAAPAAAAGLGAWPTGAPYLRRASAEAQGPALPAAPGEGPAGFSLGLSLSQPGLGSADEPQAWAIRPHAASARGNSGASDAARYFEWQVYYGSRGSCKGPCSS